MPVEFRLSYTLAGDNIHVRPARRVLFQEVGFCGGVDRHESSGANPLKKCLPSGLFLWDSRFGPHCPRSSTPIGVVDKETEAVRDLVLLDVGATGTSVASL